MVVPFEKPQLRIIGPSDVIQNARPAVYEVTGLGEIPIGNNSLRVDVYPPSAGKPSALKEYSGRWYFMFGANSVGPVRIVVNWADVSILRQASIDVVSTVSPSPNPTPIPVPPEPSPPPPPPAWYVLLYQSETDGPLVNKLLNSSSLQDFLTKHNATWIAHDLEVVDGYDKCPEALKPYAEKAKGKHPWLIVTAENGKVLWEGKPENDTRNLIDLHKTLERITSND